MGEKVEHPVVQSGEGLQVLFLILIIFLDFRIFLLINFKSAVF